jgi:hypothetical protein
MSYVIATPEVMTSAATDLANIGSNVNAAHMVAAAPTTSVIPAAADEVSAGIAQLFSQHAASYQALAAQAAAFNDQFVQHMTASAGAYASIEAALASLLQDWQNLNVDADHFVSRIASLVSIIATLPPRQLLLLPLQLLFFAGIVLLLVSYYDATGKPLINLGAF